MNDDFLNTVMKLYEHTGKRVRNKRTGKIGVVLHETESGSIVVLEKK